MVGRIDVNRVVNLKSLSGGGLSGVLPVVNGGTGASKYNACRAISTANQTGIASATYTKLNISTAVFDPDAVLDVVNHRITPNVAGTFMVNAGVYMTSVNGTMGEAQVAIYKNGSAAQYTIGSSASANNESLPINTMLVVMNGSTDYVEAFGFAVMSGTGTVTFNAGTTFSWLSAVRVGP